MIGSEGFPDQYAPEDADVALREVDRRLTEEIAAVRETAIPAAVSPFEGYPRYTNVRELVVRRQTGLYGGDGDPRFGFVSDVQGSGQSGPWQRFRFGPGTTVNPLLRGPVDLESWAYIHGVGYFAVPAKEAMAMGLYVSGIPHGLGRLPEFWIKAPSSTSRGPAGQRLEVVGGTQAAPYAAGTPIRADLDFVPILGREPADIQRALKHLVGFGDGAATASEHSFDDLAGTSPGGTIFEDPDLLGRHASDMVTTDRLFGGVLLMTVWGLPAFQGTYGYHDVGAEAWEHQTGAIRDPVTGADDQMASCPVPGLGKSLYFAQMAQITLQNLFANGFSVSLRAGSVDFIMG